MERTGVLLTAFGGPRDLDQVAPFLCSIMGSEPSEEAACDARRRYLTIGGGSPLPPMAERIAVQLERSLNGFPVALEPEEGALGFAGMPAKLERAAGEIREPVAVGMLHSEPTIAAAVAQLAWTGVQRIVSLSLSPFDSAVTTGAYREAVAAAVAEHPGVSVIDAADYRHLEPFLTALADAAQEVLFSDDIKPHRALMVFSAHSLPMEEVQRDSSYVEQLREVATEIADRIGLGDADGFAALPGIEAFGGHSGSTPWLLAFQSKGRRGGDWVGPDLYEVIDAAVAQDFGAVVVSPIGFAVDHLETLYDLDVYAADRVLSADLEFARSATPNDDPRMIEALADAVRRVL